MSKPKYLPIPKKTPYNIRMPQHLLDKLYAYAELTDNTTTDVVIGALSNFIKDKTVFNDYLPNINGVSIRLPMISSEKKEFYNVDLSDKEINADELFNEAYGFKATSEPYEILKIPNNLDIFNDEFGYTTPVGDVIGKGKHSGIEFVVIPEYYSYYDNSDDVIGALYCLYFEVEMDRLKYVKLIDYMDAINKATDSGNATLKNNLISCYNELKKLHYDVNDGGFDGAETGDIDGIIEAITVIAKKYNTGNVIPLGDNIDETVVTAKINTHPELYDEFIDEVKDKTERYVDEVIAERFHNIMNDRLSSIERKVRNAKSRDEILTAIGDAKIITKK